MTIRIALLGAGRIGQVHALTISRLNTVRLVAVADAFADAANNIAETYGCEIRTNEEIETAQDVDAVLICTPTDTHADLIERFARAGKAIFCEKPVDLDVDRVRQCLKVAAEYDDRLMIGFNRRFDPHFAELKRSITDGKLGEIEQITIISRDPGLPPHSYIAVSGGIFRDMTVHDFDMARHLLGEKLTSVSATASALIDPSIRDLDDFDTASVVMMTESGKQVTIINSRRATYGYDQRIEVHGSLGMIRAENQRPVSVEFADVFGFTRPPLHDFFMTRYLAAYEAELTSFIQALTTGAPMSPNGQDGLAAMLIAEAALASVKQDRTVQLSDIA